MSEFTPFSPSMAAIRRVKNPIEIPSLCPVCAANGSIHIKNNSIIYNGVSYGNYPWMLVCVECWGYVGFHPDTNIPLGVICDSATRSMRKKAKAKFNTLWYDKQYMSRDDA